MADEWKKIAVFNSIVRYTSGLEINRMVVRSPSKKQK